MGYSYRLNEGKHRTEVVGYSIEEARNADSKRRTQKRENRFFEILPETKIIFKQLFDWYLDLKTVKALLSYKRVKIVLNNFQNVFGENLVNNIKLVDLENYQIKRAQDGVALATIDMEISIVKTVVNKAIDNDMVNPNILKTFRKVKKKLKKGANARRRILNFDEYLKLIAVAAPHLKNIIIVGYNSGMRSGELRLLQWAYIDWDKKFIRLPSDITKEKKAKDIPINHHVDAVLTELSANPNPEHDFVFTFKNNPIKDKGGLKRSFKTACKNAEISCGRDVADGLIFHDIRRTVKTNMLTSGMDKVHRDMILGHSLKGMDVHYLVPSEENLTNAMKRYTEWLDNNLSTANTSL